MLESLLEKFLTVTFDQYIIFIFGVTAIRLSQAIEFKVRRWGCIFALIAQPFWFYAAYVSELWGVFLMSFAYTWAWARGFYNNWYLPWKATHEPT